MFQTVSLLISSGSPVLQVNVCHAAAGGAGGGCEVQGTDSCPLTGYQVCEGRVYSVTQQ